MDLNLMILTVKQKLLELQEFLKGYWTKYTTGDWEQENQIQHQYEVSAVKRLEEPLLKVR